MALKIRRLISSVFFCMIVVLCAVGLSGLQRDQHMSNWNTGDDYPYEALWVGSSHIYRTIIPQLLYDDYGLATLSVSTAGQTSYHTLTTLEDLHGLEEMKLVIMDVFSFLRPYTYSEDYNHSLSSTDPSLIPEDQRQNRFTLSSSALRQMKESNPLKYVRLLGEKEMEIPLQYYFSLFNSHSQYLRMDRSNFEVTDTRFSRHKNYEPSLYAWPLEDPLTDEIVPDDSIVFNEQCRNYLMRIIDLCEQKNVPLLLIAIPYDVSNAERIVLQEIEQIAQEHELDYLSMETIVEEATIEWDNDFMDHGHTNHMGAVKITDFLGSYLTSNYEFTDRAAEDLPDSPFLQNQYGYYAYEVMATKDQLNMADYLESLYNLDESYLLLFTTGEDRGTDLTEWQRETLCNLGFAIPEDSSTGFNLRQINAGSATLMQSEDSILTNLDAHTLEIDTFIHVDHEQVSLETVGSQLVILDRCSQRVIDSIAFGRQNDTEVWR